LLQQGTKMDHGRHEANGYEGSTGRKVTLVALIRHHLRDWLWIVVMAILELVDYFLIPPFKRFITATIVQNYRFPMKGETVPTWSVGVIAVVLPFLIFLAVYIKKRSIRDLHNAFLGLAMAIVITALFTDGIKNLVGMPRPDFYHRCFPDGVATYTNDADQQVICHPNVSARAFHDAYKSFPSGHVSWAFAGLGYLSFYLAGKMSLFDRRGYASRVFWVLFPVFVATLIGISRVNDYQHRWVDIIAAGLLGTPIAYLCYRQFFPSVYAREWAGYPYEYPPQGAFSHGLHGPHALPMMNSQFNSTVAPLGVGGNAYDPRWVPNDVETGRN
jgi:diacylglycerol diphosphate phosphatase/phosphatidate phosphatase